MKRYPFFILLLLFLFSCGKKDAPERTTHPSQAAIAKNAEFFKRFGEIKLYKKGSISEKNLLKCAYAMKDRDSCSLKELPLLGMGEKVTIERVLSRTLISHDFMGKNFEAALRSVWNQKLELLFGSVPLIIISDKINPSFYSSTAGAIYISPRYLWMTATQKAISTKRKDNRGSTIAVKNIQKLKFEFYSSERRNHQNIRSQTKKPFRTIKDLKYNFYRLLIHELTHAADHAPHNFYSDPKLNTEEKIGPLLFSRYKKYKLISDHLLYPSKNEILKTYQKISNQNQEIPDELLNISLEEVTEKYISESACEIYAYYTPLEDMAMLIEDLFLLSDYSVERVQGIIQYPHNNFEIPKDYKYPFYWGQINRILEPKVLERALDAAQKLFPLFNEASYLNQVKGKTLKDIPSGTSLFDANSGNF